jgi:hypothetical protein|tara:strand:- start:335 stop:1387 length:1053 start_codon:yes stop_codon:yes gene_type:complete
MATTQLTIGNELLSTTMHILMKDFRDNVHESVAFLDAQERIHGAGKPVQSGGSRIVVPLGFGEHSSTTRMQTGFERIDLSVEDVFVPAQYDFGHVVRPVAISSEEEMVNQGDAAVLSILESRVMMTANAMKREFVKQIVAGGQTGWEDWNTLNGADVTTGDHQGFLEIGAAGTQVNAVGGVDKGDYLTKTGWQNQAFDGSASFNSNGLAGLYDLKVEINAVSPSGPPNVILASRAGFKNLKRALQAHERYVDQSQIDGGRMVEMFDGVPINVEFNMPNSGGTTSGDPISFYFLNMNDIYTLWDPKGYFDLSDFETVSGEYDVRAAKLRCRGQLIAKHLGSSGVAFDLETF